MTDDARPEVSVVVASVNGLPYPLACLEALADQIGDVTHEVVVADSTGPSTVAAVRERFPEVRVLSYGEPQSVPWLRAEGIRHARGRLVAVTEDHCVPRRDWLLRIVEGQRRTGWAAIGGGVENDATTRAVDWAVFFCEYHHLMSPVPGGPSDALPGMNVAYDMDVLGPLVDLFAEGLWENFLHERIRAAGHTMGLDERIIVGHRKHFTIPMFLSERFNYSRSFAAMRVGDAPLSTRITWAAATAALPALLLTRLGRQVAQRRQHVGWFIRSFPLVVLFTLAWSAGEFVGYLAGPGDSLLKVR